MTLEHCPWLTTWGNHRTTELVQPHETLLCWGYAGQEIKGVGRPAIFCFVIEKMDG